MPLTVGVIGPEDLVRKVVAVGGDAGRSGFGRLLPLPYRHEEETAGIAAGAGSTADALLFTGVVPYGLAAAAGALDRPATYVPYSGATLLRALVELLRLGHDVSRVSIDTLRRDEVLETLTEAKLPTEHIRVLPHRPGLTSQDLVDFHLDARDTRGARVAITCLGSAFHVLEHRTHTVRLAPSRHSVLGALRALALDAAGRQSGDAQVALGVIELPTDGGGPSGGLPGGHRPADGRSTAERRVDERSLGERSRSEGPAGERPAGERPAGERSADGRLAGERLVDERPAGQGPAGERSADERLADDVRVLGASLAALPDGRRLVVTTRGVLEKATDRFTRIPFLDGLAARHGTAHIGFGVGRTAAEAEALARRAVKRARSVGPAAGVVSMTDDVDIVIDGAAADSAGEAVGGSAPPGGAALLARRVGISPQTLDRLRELASGERGEELTAHAVAGYLSVQQRTARRILKRLERAGVAVPTGIRQEGQTGRPPTVYRVRL
ncbi:hypothetical protein [Streptomyces pacificus]|uniref:Transcriptional regulator n=1 Tax=Streptomyces pacificus TaxID=2705029 RepID=A0A6A0ASU2_9ACTN|nr:hypothetical protein [Streptomyces pacificus]GFH35778.1 hypothetical protein SCWH03_20000 [Streptomyces pacificus]